jgi:hypothetical protein
MKPIKIYIYKTTAIISMVLKTGPDRPVQPVQPGTDVLSGPVLFENRKFRKNAQKPETDGSIGITANRNG